MTKQDQQRTDKYWRDRALKSESEMNNSVDATELHILGLFNTSQSYIDNRIVDLKRRMESRTGMTPEEIEYFLNQPAEQDRVIETAQNIMQIKDKKVREAMMNASTAQAFKFRITREFEIKQAIDATLQRMGESYNDVLTDKYETIASKAYTDAAKELAKPLNIHIGDDVTKQVLETKWFGGNYSDRIWRDTNELAKTLKDLLTVESLTGMSQHQMSDALAQKFSVSKGVARRLIRTESNFVHNQGRLRSWKDNGIEKYVLIAVKDSRTSVFCRHIDGKVFNVKDARAEGMSGNYPPFHAWCRTVASAYFGDGKAGDSYDPYDKQTFTVPNGSNYDTEMQKRHDIKSRYKMHDMLEALQADEKNFDNYRKYNFSKIPDNLMDFQKLRRGDDWDAFKADFQSRRSHVSIKRVKKMMEHIEGTPEWEARKAADEANGKKFTYFTMPFDEIKRIILEKAVLDDALKGRQTFEISENVGVAQKWDSQANKFVYVKANAIQIQQNKVENVHAFPVYDPKYDKKGQ